MMKHVRVLLDAFKNHESLRKIKSRDSYVLLSKIFKTKSNQNILKETEYRQFMVTLSLIKDPVDLIDLKDNHYPISKEQVQIINEFLESKYKNIEKVNDIGELITYLTDKYVAKHITKEYLEKTKLSVSRHIHDMNDIMIAQVYLDYMNFLINSYNNSGSLSEYDKKNYLQPEMIRTQKEWEEEACDKVFANMHSMKSEGSIDKEEIERFSELAIMNPVYFAESCVPCNDIKLIKILDEIPDEGILAHISNPLVIDRTYPHQGGYIDLENHDVDNLLLDNIRKICERKSYEISDLYKPEEYLSNIHERWKWGIFSTIYCAAVSMFRNENPRACRAFWNIPI